MKRVPKGYKVRYHYAGNVIFVDPRYLPILAKEFPLPSKSKAQHDFMAACAHSPSKMKAKCPPKKVAREFLAADKKAAKKK